MPGVEPASSDGARPPRTAHTSTDCRAAEREDRRRPTTQEWPPGPQRVLEAFYSCSIKANCEFQADFRLRLRQEKVGKQEGTAEEQQRRRNGQQTCSMLLEHGLGSGEGGAGVQNTRFNSWSFSLAVAVVPADTRQKVRQQKGNSKRSNVRLCIPKSSISRQSQSDPGRRHSPQTLRWVCLARPSKSDASRNSSASSTQGARHTDQRYEDNHLTAVVRTFDRLVGTIKGQREEKLPSFLAGFPTYLRTPAGHETIKNWRIVPD